MKNKKIQMKSKKIIIGIIAVVIVIVGIFVSLNSRTETTELTVEDFYEIPTLVIYTNIWEPHAYLDENGKASGISVDIMDLVFSRLNLSYEISFVPWSRAIKAVELGEIDAMILTAHTQEREDFLYFTEEEISYVRGEPIPHTASSMSNGVFFARNVVKDGITFESLDDIREGGYRVAAVANFRTTGELHDAGITVLEYPDDTAEIQALADGVADLALIDKAIAVPLLKNMGLTDEISSFPQSFFKNPLYMLFSKKSDYPNKLELREQILDELRKIHESGEYDEIYNSYIE